MYIKKIFIKCAMEHLMKLVLIIYIYTYIYRTQDLFTHFYITSIIACIEYNIKCVIINTKVKCGGI